jgi:hypothetical protein
MKIRRLKAQCAGIKPGKEVEVGLTVEEQGKIGFDSER